MGRGFHCHTEQRDDQGCVVNTHEDEPKPEAASYLDVFADKRISALTAADVFHVIAEANVGLIFNAMLAGVGNFGNNDDDDGNNDDASDDDAIMSRSAIPLLATAGSAAQIFMILGTYLVGHLTAQGWGRKPFYVAHLSIHDTPYPCDTHIDLLMDKRIVCLAGSNRISRGVDRGIRRRKCIHASGYIVRVGTFQCRGCFPG